MKTYIGGQAVIEGVMMASRKKIAVAVRTPKKKIKLKIEKRSPVAERFRKTPLLRGLVSLFEMLVIGTKALNWSSNQQLETDEQLSSWAMTLTLLFSLGLAIGLFIALPLWLSGFASDNRIIFNLVDGFWRIVLFVGYLYLISRSKEIQRVFQYHGAEHKTINCYEQQKPLTIKNVQKCSTIHPRCGTSFTFIVLIISILLFSLIWSDYWYIKFLERIVLIPVIAAVGYEVLRYNATGKSKLLQWLTIPGLWLQKITTREPDDDMVKVAVKAFNAVK